MNVSSVSDYALKLLGDRTKGQVHSVFGTSFNVKLAGNLVHVGPDSCSLSCLGMNIAAGEMPCVVRAIAQGDPVAWDGDRLVIWGSSRAISLAVGAAPVACLGIPRAVGTGVGLDAELYAALEPLGLLDRIGLPWHGEERSVTALTGLARFSSMCLARELGAEVPLREESAQRAMRAAVDYLVGRGLGLTPSGDDVLCGYGCGLWFLYGGRGLAASYFDAVAAAYPGKTTAVSEAYLNAICAGYANADYIGLCSALRAGGVAMLPARLSRVLEVGHTSGADGLLGFGAALCCLL